VRIPEYLRLRRVGSAELTTPAMAGFGAVHPLGMVPPPIRAGRGRCPARNQYHLAYLPIRVLTCMSAADGGPGPLPGVRCSCAGQSGTAGDASHEDQLRPGGVGRAVDPVNGEAPWNPGAIPGLSSDAPAPAAPPRTAREVLDVPSHPEEGVQRHIEYLLTPGSRPRPGVISAVTRAVAAMARGLRAGRGYGLRVRS
jgi:hypothetical protein